MATQHQKTIAWVKSCNCKACATPPTIKFEQKVDEVRCVFQVMVTFSPGPHCDKCGEPWRRA